MKVTTEAGWDYTEIHIDLEIPFEEEYQLSMISHNEIEGLMKVKGSGRDGRSRYTYRISDGVSMEKMFGVREMKKEDIEKFTCELLKITDTMRTYLLNPDHILLSPELIYLREGKYYFCYLPVFDENDKKLLSRSFHEMTEYFVRRLDYQDTEGVFFVYRLHRETLREGYELKKILTECRAEEKKRAAAGKYNARTGKNPGTAAVHAEKQKEKQKKEEQKEKHAENKIQEENSEDTREDEMILCGPVRRVINRIKTGRWGEWDDLITEMDGKKK